MWFDFRDVPRPNDIPPWSTGPVTSGENHWYDSLMSVRLFAAFGPNAQNANNLNMDGNNLNRDANGQLMTGSDERNCAVTNYDNTINGIWDDRECTEQNCHVCAQGWGELWVVNNGPNGPVLGYHNYGDDETGIDEFGVDDFPTDAVF